MRRRAPLTAALSAPVAAILMALLVGCSSTDGRTLPPPGPAHTTTTPSTPVIQPSESVPEAFEMTSEAFVDGGPFPDAITCQGARLSPPLAWTGVPEDTAALAIVARDLTDGGFVHWVVTGIDPGVQGFAAGGVPEGAVEAANEADQVGWLAPCPAAGSGLHRYEVALLALPAVVILPEGATVQQAAALLETAAGERAVMTGTVTAAP